MQIVINHLTRMKPGFFCAAGVELESTLHVRPLFHGHLTTDLLARNGGRFSLGAHLELGQTRFAGRVPEIEDRTFEPEQLQKLGQLDHRQLFDLCAELAVECLEEIFTDAIKPCGSTAAIDEHCGLRSLGCLWISGASLTTTAFDQTPQIRLNFEHWGRTLSVPVTDLRLYSNDYHTLNHQALEACQDALRARRSTLLCVGISRPYRKSDSDAAKHWLQVNNILTW